MLIAILGAGAASRFGSDKLMTDCAGKPLGQWALDAALTLGKPILWVGNDSRPDFLPPQCNFQSNPNAEQGLGTSLALAASTAKASDAKALLVMLADMPLITGAILKNLVAMGPFAACAYETRAGVPALFPARLFEDLSKLDGDRGAAPLLRNATDLALVSVNPEKLLDVDTSADLEQARALLSRV